MVCVSGGGEECGVWCLYVIAIYEAGLVVIRTTLSGVCTIRRDICEMEVIRERAPFYIFWL